MKPSLIIAISGILFGGVFGFIITDRNNANHISKGRKIDLPNTKKSTTRKVTPRKNSAHRVISYLDDTSQRGITADIHNILKLNVREIKALIAGAEFNTLDEDNTPLFNAALSRLAEIDPAIALTVAEELDTARKQTALHSVFREWSFQDTEGLISMALDGQLSENKGIALHSALSNLSKQDPSRALKLAKDHNVRTAMDTIIINLSKKDPLRALDESYLLSPDNRKINQDLIAKEWYLDSPEKVAIRLKNIKSKKKKSQILTGLIQTIPVEKAFELLDENIDNIYASDLGGLTAKLVIERPIRMMSWLEKLPEGKDKSKLISKAIEYWFSIDESKALAYYESISNISTKEAASANLLKRLTMKDPKKFIELYPIIGQENPILPNISRALKKLAVTDLEYTTEYLNGLTDTEQRKQAVGAIFEGLSEKDANQALLAADQLGEHKERDMALAIVYKRIAAKDPQTVINAFKERGMKNIGDFRFSSFVYSYSKEHIEEAKSLVDSIEDPLIWSSSISAMINSWSYRDPLAALEFTLQQEPETNFAFLLSSISKKIAEKEPHKALTIILSQPENSISRDALSSVLSRWVDQDVEAAVKALQSVPVDQAGTHIYSAAAKKYAQTNAPKGSEWVNSIRDQKAKDSATSSLMGEWLERDLDSAISWLETMHDGSQRDTAVHRVVSAYRSSDPIYAIEWANTLSEESSSKSLIKSTYSSWKKNDPQAANQWLNSTNLVTNDDRENW